MSRLFTLIVVAFLSVLVSACAVGIPMSGEPSPAAMETATAVTEGDASGRSGGMGGDASGGVAEELSGELIVFAAASLTNAFSEIAADFQSLYPETTIIYSFAGSQQLAQQLGQGAPADLFASADEYQMEVAIEAGRVESGSTSIFAHNRLLVIYPADNPAALTTLRDLARPGVKLVLAAPEVPVGRYSLDFLEKASASAEFGSTYGEAVVANVVSYEESVRSVLSKVVLGEADAGIVYTSDVTGSSADQVGQIEIADEFNTLANYPIVPVRDSQNPTLARAFIDYLLSPSGQAVLADYGFIPAGVPEP